MRALMLVDRKKLELVEVGRPVVGEGEVLVRVRACGICGSDVHGWDGSTRRRIPPVIMGHEAAGEIAEVGGGVTKFKVGERVTFDSTVWCGACVFCLEGRVNLCEKRMVLGVSCGEYRRDGCFAEYVVVPERIVYRLPEGMSFEEAAMVEAVSIAVHAVARGGVKAGERVVVVGAGMIGQLIVQAAKAAGCGVVAAVDLDEGRLAAAKKCGADFGLEAWDGVAEEVLAVMEGAAELVFEAVGNQRAMGTALGVVRKGGRVVLVGNVSPKVEVGLQGIVTREVTLLGSCASSGEYPKCLELMAEGKIRVGELISAVGTLEEGAQWFERLYNRERGVMKVILRP